MNCYCHLRTLTALEAGGWFSECKSNTKIIRINLCGNAAIIVTMSY